MRLGPGVQPPRRRVEPLAWFRARLGPIAIAALVSLAGLTSLSAAVHDAGECHDECAAGVLRHDPWSHAIGSATADAEHPLHCVLCHWTRTVRPSAETVHVVARPLAQNVRSVSDVLIAPLRALAAQPPLRSPPRPAPGA
jgi:hypothetical protein